MAADITSQLAQAGNAGPFVNVERVFYLIYSFATGAGGGAGLISVITGILALITPYAIGISLLLLIGIVYTHIRLLQIRKIENEQLYGESSVPEPAAREAGEPKNPRWQRVQSLIDSDADSDWRRAILEADIMLDEMLSNMGYQGEGVGDKLKQIERSDFRTLDRAWEAHKARNAIAHEGESFQLTQRQARRIISLFEEVFQEFYYI